MNPWAERKHSKEILLPPMLIQSFETIRDLMGHIQILIECEHLGACNCRLEAADRCEQVIDDFTS